MTITQDANFIVIGAGAVGCGVAYSLAKSGQREIIVIDKEPHVGGGTSSQAAGLVGQLRSSVERIRLAMWSVETFSNMQRESGIDLGWRQVGSLRIALTDERVEEFRRLKRIAEQAGLPVEFVDADFAKRKWPVMDFETAKAILWCPSDGYLQPSDLVMAYRTLAARSGARFLTDAALTDFVMKDGRIVGVDTSSGRLGCRTAINAAGPHAWHVAKLAGLDLPIIPVRHWFIVTEPADGVRPDFPVVRIPDASIYLRAEVNSLLVGGWEPNGLSLSPSDYELKQDPPHIADDWEVLSWFAAGLAPLCAMVEDLGVQHVFKGWPTFTPDGRFIIGPSRRVEGLVMAGGCNAHGVSGSAGIGRHVVESILEAEPSPYVKSLRPDRFSEAAWDWETVRRQAQAVGERYYAIDY